MGNPTAAHAAERKGRTRLICTLKIEYGETEAALGQEKETSQQY